MAMPQNVIDCDASVINPSDPLCERMQGLLSSAQVFCAFRNWAFATDGSDITQEFQDMIQPAGAAGGDLDGTYPDPTVRLLAVTSAKMSAMGGVTPGPYVNPSLTVDVAGRITAIADGAAPVFGANAQVTGSGANHTAVGTYTNVVFGATDPVITLPASGTYLLTAVIKAVLVGTVSRFLRCQLYNVTSAAAIADSPRDIGLNYDAGGTLQAHQLVLSNIVAIGAASVTIQAMADGLAFPPQIVANMTSISYIRLD